jgi:hypothetical protein
MKNSVLMRSTEKNIKYLQTTYYFALRNTYNYFPLPNHFLIVVFLLLNGAIFAVNKPIQN